MDTITDYMSIDHRHCDDVFAALERSVSIGDWQTADRTGEEFIAVMLEHFSMEEDVLFPAIEMATGSKAGPTAVMRAEHQQMRDIISELRDALQQRDGTSFAGIADTLNIMIQQHNMKEEGILYPLADHLLAGSREILLSDMNNHHLPAEHA